MTIRKRKKFDKTSYKWRAFGAIIVSVVCIFLSLPPISMVPLSYVALIPLFRVLRSQKLSFAYKGFISFVYTWLIGVVIHFWVYYPAVEYGQYTFWVGLALIVFYGVIANVEIFVACILASWVGKTKTHLIPIIFGLVMWIFTYIPLLKVFPSTLSDTQVVFTWMAPVFFFLGRGGSIAFWIFANLFFEGAWQAVQKRDKSSVFQLCRDMAIVLVIVISLNVVRGVMDRAESSDSTTVHFLMIQPNIGNAMKLSSELGMMPVIKRVITNFHLQTEQALKKVPIDKKPLIVVWPETAYPIGFQEEVGLAAKRIDAQHMYWMNQFQDTHFIFGSYGYAKPGNGGLQNSMVWYGKQALKASYDKQTLLALGEFLPFRRFLPQSITSLWPYEDFSAGTTWNTWNMDMGLRMLPIICYEILFEDTSRFAFSENANLIVNLTNDSWFVVTLARELHLMMAKVRAALTGLPIFRATNTGITAYINNWGKVEHRTLSNKPTSLFVSASIPLNPFRPYFWYWLQIVLGGLCLLSLFQYLNKRR